MSDDRQELILLATSEIDDNSSSCSQAASTGVLTKLLTGNNTSATSSQSTYILYIPAFRKIEPKPGLELKGDGEVEEKEVIEREAKSSVGRFLAINATKRGVKTCPVCLKKIGYRAKQCKHCSPSKIRNPRKPRLPHIKPTFSLKMGGASLNRTKPGEVGQHATQGSQESSQHGSQESVQGGLISSDGVNNEEPIVTTQEGEQEQFETMVPPQEDQPSLDGFESSLNMRTHQQQLGSENTESQQLLDLASINQDQLIVPPQTQQELDSLKPQGDQHELGASVRNILDQTDRQPIVIEDAMVSNVTEVSTSGDSTQKIGEETGVQEVLNSVFISTKITQHIDTETASNDTPGRYSLQDLICGLLAQNQGIDIEANHAQPKEGVESIEESACINIEANQAQPKEGVESIEESACMDIQTESIKSPTPEETDSRSKTPSETRNKDKSASETSYDANSVALFLGEMAQRNNGKKRKMIQSKTVDSEAKVVTIIPGVSQKCILLTGNEAKAAKFRKIQPKDVGSVQEEPTVCDNENEANKEINIDNKGELQCRIMNGNATRRGVMSCNKCNKMIGCRSKICKHCKTNVTESPARQVSSKTIKQAVKLGLPEHLDIQVFSVRKCKTGPELRCFVQFDNKGKDESSKSFNSEYSCDYPLCVTAKELGNNDYMCEHAKVCCNSGSTLKARLPKLDSQTLQTMPFGPDMKELVHKLYSECLSKGVVLVQYVSCRTLAVVQHMNGDSSDPLGADIITFAHVRFENVKGQGCFQRQVFCSGRSCMAWNFLSNDSHPAVMKPCSCVHYAAALWAIASDDMLQRDLGEYLDAFVAQSKKGNS